MADLDTVSKRGSSLQVLQPWQTVQPMPTLVTGDIDQGDRQHIAWSYSGILAAAAGGDPEGLLIGGKLLQGLLMGGVLVR